MPNTNVVGKRTHAFEGFRIMLSRCEAGRRIVQFYQSVELENWQNLEIRVVSLPKLNNWVATHITYQQSAGCFIIPGAA